MRRVPSRVSERTLETLRADPAPPEDLISGPSWLS